MKDIRCHPSLLLIQILTKKIISVYILRAPWIRIRSNYNWFSPFPSHDLSKRLSKQISQAKPSMQTALDKCNNLECSLPCPFPFSLECDQVKNPEADVWLRSEFVGSDSLVPITVRRGFLLSLVAEMKKASVNRSFDFLPPLHFFAFSKRLLSGSAR